MGDIALRGNKLTRTRVKKGLGGLLKGGGKAIFKKKPKPSKANNWKGESMFDWVDRKAAEDAAAGGWPPPKIKPGKIAKNIVKAGKVGAVAVPGSYAYGKWKIHKRNKKKKRAKKAIGGLLKQGFKVLKGPANKFRMEQAKNLKKHRLKTKIEKGRAGREARKIVSDWDKKHVSSNPELKRAMSQARHPKSWRRQITKKLKESK